MLLLAEGSAPLLSRNSRRLGGRHGGHVAGALLARGGTNGQEGAETSCEDAARHHEILPVLPVKYTATRCKLIYFSQS